MKWTEKSERGSESLMMLFAWLARSVGRAFCRVLLYPIVLYFLVTDRIARHASFEFLQAVKGHPAKISEVFDHLYSFAATLLDRVYMADHEFQKFEVSIENQHLVDEALKKNKGCLLLGSHLGSFDLMALATRAMDPRPLNIMMRVDPRSRLRRIAGIDDSLLRVIPLGAPNSLLKAYEALTLGEVVATLADRIEGRSALPVQFFGRSVMMPLAPYVLAARSGAPMLACFGIYEGKNRYRIKFIEMGVYPEKKSRICELQSSVDRYAQLLEEQAKIYPFNWFNFYPYWDEERAPL